jgi:hypothetical protein
MRYLFPDPRTIEHTLGYGQKGGYAMLPIPKIEKACIPLELAVELGGEFAIANFKKKLREHSPDDALVLAFELV